MNTPHKYAEVIHAWADGKEIQFRNSYRYSEETKWTEWNTFMSGNSPMWNHPSIEWRIRPIYPTLGQIAKEAWFSTQPKNAAPSCWEAAAKAVQKAIESGEHS